MNTTLAYEAQKAIIEERLRNAALVQHQLLAPDHTKRSVATRIRRRRAARRYAPWLVRSA